VVELLAAALEHVLQSLYRPHVLGAFESSGIGAAELAHAALHLLHGFVFVFVHPLQNALFHLSNVPDAMKQ
jgi:hypothetical protein